MRMMRFAGRNTKEILRDKINLMFGLGFPLVVLFLLTAIQSNIPVSLFELSSLTPGIAVFGLSFVSLFSGMLIAKDRSSSFMVRLLASPLTASDFIAGYTLPLMPLAMGQTVVCFIAAVALGLEFSPEYTYGTCSPFALRCAFHRNWPPVRQRIQRQAGGRNLRRASDQPDRVAFRHLV